jgi:aspartate racemase
MIPSVFVLFNALPLTPSGKIDRRALPAPELRPGDARELVAARDSLEMQLTCLWEAVLGVHPIGVTDNFFDLGGHSLLAVQLFDRIARALGRLPASSLSKRPRLTNWPRSWAGKLVTDVQSLVAVKPGGKSRACSLLRPQGVPSHSRQADTLS